MASCTCWPPPAGGGLEYGEPLEIGNGPVLVSSQPGTQYMSRKPLENGPSLVKSCTVPRTVQSGMRDSSRSSVKPGAPTVTSNGLFASRSPIVSDSPQEIACRPMRRKIGPLEMFTYA